MTHTGSCGGGEASNASTDYLCGADFPLPGLVAPAAVVPSAVPLAVPAVGVIPTRSRYAAMRRPQVAKVVVHPGEMENWARHPGRHMNAQARADFAGLMWQTE
jgi:hypothetical protein